MMPLHYVRHDVAVRPGYVYRLRSRSLLSSLVLRTLSTSNINIISSKSYLSSRPPPLLRKGASLRAAGGEGGRGPRARLLLLLSEEP